MEALDASGQKEKIRHILGEVDDALKADRDKSSQRVMDQVRAAQEERLKNPNLPRLLRIMGSAVVIAAALTFMVQQWEDMNHIVRYFSFLGFTALLSISGFFCGLKISEDKGARTLLALAAAIIPVHFCQLGGLLYSQAGLVPQADSFYPKAFLWKAPDLFMASMTTTVGVLTLIPIAILAFMALVRPEAKRLTVAYILSNAALLIPSRDSNLIALIAFLVFLGTVLFDSKYLQHVPAVRTKEGLICRVMLAVPFFVLIGRSMHLYELSYLFVSMLFAAAAVMLFSVLPRYLQSEGAKSAAQANSVPFAGISWFIFVMDMAATLNIARDYVLPSFAIPFAALLAVMSLFAVSDGKSYRYFAAILLNGAVIVELCIFGGIFSSLLCIVTAILTVAYGQATEQKTVFLSGAFALVCGLIYHLRYAVHLFTYSPWLSLALIGILTVVASSFIERNHQQLRGRITALKNSVRNWR